MTTTQIFGRTGSLFTRVALIFADELSVPVELVPIEDMRALDPAVYGMNPALKLPTMRRGSSALFGAQNICRALAEDATVDARVVWPEDLPDDVCRNAHELTLHCMNAQVQLVVGTKIASLLAENVFFAKTLTGLRGSLAWLDAELGNIESRLPRDRTLSFLEVCLFCLLEHLRFRETVPLAPYSRLLRFAEVFGRRASAERTVYR